MKNSLLEQLAAEIRGNRVSEPPKDSVTIKGLMEQTGLSRCRCQELLLAKERAGLLKRFRVGRVSYWVAID